MCEGSTHAWAGAVTGAAAGLYVLHLDPPHTVLLTGLSAGAGLLLDLDHPQATLAHTFGFLTKTCAEVVGKVSGGHRHGTHSIVGVAVFTGLAALSVAFRHDLPGRIGLCVLLSLILAGGFCALRLARAATGLFGHVPASTMNHAADAAAIGAAVAMASTGAGLGLMATATGLGCVAHLVTDALTDQGIPILWPLSKAHFKLLPEPLSFTTGTRPERWVVAPALILALLYLSWHAVTLTGVPLHTALPTHH